MGNQLVGIAPSQIYPVEHYMTDLHDLTFLESLGSTRFFKVAKAGHIDGEVVVKIFTIHDPSFNTRKDRDKLLEIKKSLEGCVNCLPFQRVLLTDRAGFIERQFVKHSLYDRMSTRPFLTLIEQKWIAFQLLVALQQAHRNGVCHGDIKMENVMVTSGNWVLLTDFASFKPTFLPEDDPADYSFFFDTSRRRTCYLAPERFVTRKIPEQAITEAFLPESNSFAGTLAQSMDIFSAGCCLIELFSNGHTPFTFSQLLSYRAGEYTPDKVLDRIAEDDIRDLLKHMIAKDPSERLSVDEYLEQQRGKVFPEYFYSFLQSFMQVFCTDPTMTSDTKIYVLYEEMDDIMERMNTEGEIDQQGIVLLCSLITAQVRSLRFVESKLKVLGLISKLSKNVPSSIILDRLLPFVQCLLGDPQPQVRIEALGTVTQCVQQVTDVQLADANIFPEYIFPAVLPLCMDKNPRVRKTLARDIAEIASQSVRFLDLVLLGEKHSDCPMPSYDTELLALHESVAQAVSVLLADPNNAVKQMLLEHSITKLATFFGKVKANDVLLSHMITFLNDKEDTQLRKSFYENIVGVASFVGWHCSSILHPLMQQGLMDSEELVIVKCIDAMANLTELGLLPKGTLYDLLRETAPYLLHPNIWLRQSTAGFISAACKVLDVVDVRVKVGRIVEPFLKNEVIQMHMPELILNNLQSYIPRAVYEGAIKFPDLKAFLQVLEERQTARRISGRMSNGMPNPGQQATYADMPPHVKQLFRRLVSDGLLPQVEDKLLHMKEQLIKLAKNRAMVKKPEQYIAEGNIDLYKHGFDKEVEVRNIMIEADLTRYTSPSPRQLDPPPLNEEWQHMFGGGEHELETATEATDTMVAERQVTPQPSRKSPQPTQPSTAGGEHPNEYVFAACKIEFDALVASRKKEFNLAARRRLGLGQDHHHPPRDWKPRGILVAHLHEHERGINKLIRLPERTVFASGSADGCIRLWDMAKFEGSNIANKAHKMFNHHAGSSITAMDVCGTTDLLASASENGGICVYRMELQMMHAFDHLDTADLGPAISFCFYETGSSPMLIYGTAFGKIRGWDLRAPKPAFELENDVRNGVQTALAVSPDQNWCVSGTSSGQLACYDLRFKLPVGVCVHPSEARIHDLEVSSARRGTVLVSVQGNNEVGLWSIESQCRQKALWASASPVLTNSNPSTQSVYALKQVREDAVITAGTDMRVRYWDLKKPSESFIVAPAGVESIHQSQITYKYKIVDGTDVIQECHSTKLPRSSLSPPPPSSGVTDMGSKPLLDAPASGHHDLVSALTLCQGANNWYVATGSKDGVIKVWK